MRRPHWILAGLAALALLLGACGDSDDDTGDGSESSGEDGGSSDADAEFIELVQEQLTAVGCYDGPIDGIDGAGTTAATRAFQAATGLAEDGIVGGETETALVAAVDAGETVCSEPATPGDGGSGDGNSGDAGGDEGDAGDQTVTVESASFGNDFELDTCSLEPDLANGFLTGTNDADLTIEIDVVEGEGTLAIDGGNEQDGIILNGDVDEFSADEARAFSGSGTYTAPNFEGEEFTFSGSCPE